MKKKTNCSNESQAFYICSICGNIITKLRDSGITPQCCSRTMTRLEASETDGALEKHKPYWTIDGNTIHVVVGSTAHPMEENHYIQWIFLKTSTGFHYKELSPDEKAEADFVLAQSESASILYAYCNIHGLWSSCIDIGHSK